MQKIRIAVIGFGNVGREVVASVQESPDMELVGVVEIPEVARNLREKLGGLPVVSDIDELGEVDVAILAIASRSVPQIAPIYLEKGINTVDAFDIHGDSVIELKDQLASIAIKNNSVAIISAGWDPGISSIVRGLMEAVAPRGITYTNYGPGVSLGHTVAAKAIDGVEDAVSMTIPEGNGAHKRMVYVKIKPNWDFKQVEDAIKKDAYFNRDNTLVFRVDEVRTIIDMGHGVRIERKGGSGRTHNQRMEFTMLVTNPAATAQVMISAARASIKQSPGCYSMLEIPPIHYLSGEVGKNILKLV